jgi:hypothetical protein
MALSIAMEFPQLAGSDSSERSQHADDIALSCGGDYNGVHLARRFKVADELAGKSMMTMPRRRPRPAIRERNRRRRDLSRIIDTMHLSRNPTPRRGRECLLPASSVFPSMPQPPSCTRPRTDPPAARAFVHSRRILERLAPRDIAWPMAIDHRQSRQAWRARLIPGAVQGDAHGRYGVEGQAGLPSQRKTFLQPGSEVSKAATLIVVEPVAIGVAGSPISTDRSQVSGVQRTAKSPRRC